MKRILLLLVFPLVFCGCQNEENATTTDPVTMEFSQVAKGDLYGNGGEDIGQGGMVINSQAEWQVILDQITLINDLPNTFQETEIDFEAFTVIAVFDAVQMNGGHFIDITNVEMVDRQIVVSVDNTSDGGGDMTAMISQPFAMVKIPKTTLPIVFE